MFRATPRLSNSWSLLYTLIVCAILASHSHVYALTRLDHMRFRESISTMSDVNGCPQGALCCINPENKQNEKCPYTRGVCCDVGDEQDGGFCCPSNHKCIAEHTQGDDDESGANSNMRISCWNNAGGNKPLALPDAARTVNIAEAAVNAAAQAGDKRASASKADDKANNVWGDAERSDADHDHEDDSPTVTIKKVRRKHRKIHYQRAKKMRSLKLKHPDVVTLQNDNHIFGVSNEENSQSGIPHPKDTRLNKLTERYLT